MEWASPAELHDRIRELKAALSGLQKQLRGRLLGTVQLLSLKVEGQLYGVSLEAVDRVVWIPRLDPCEGAPEGVVGLLNLEGEALFVLELRQLLGIEPTPWHAYTPLVVLEWGERKLGLIADELGEVLELEVDAPDPALPFAAYIASYHAGPPSLAVLDHTCLLEQS